MNEIIILKKELEVKNLAGIHVRPASMIVRFLQDKESEVKFIYDNVSISAKSVISILMLGAPQFSKITIIVEGKDAEEVLKGLLEIFDNKFGED